MDIQKLEDMIRTLQAQQGVPLELQQAISSCTCDIHRLKEDLSLMQNYVDDSVAHVRESFLCHVLPKTGSTSSMKEVHVESVPEPKKISKTVKEFVVMDTALRNAALSTIGGTSVPLPKGGGESSSPVLFCSKGGYSKKGKDPNPPPSDPSDDSSESSSPKKGLPLPKKGKKVKKPSSTEDSDDSSSDDQKKREIQKKIL